MFAAIPGSGVGVALVTIAFPLHMPAWMASPATAQSLPDRCASPASEPAPSLNALFRDYPIQIVPPNPSVAQRLGYFFQGDLHLHQTLKDAFDSQLLTGLTIEVVTQQSLYRDRAEAQNQFDEATQQATIRLADYYVIGDYAPPCTLSLAGIENEFSEVILRARYYATYGQPLRASVYQEAATLSFSSLASLVYQGESFTSAEAVRIVLQDVVAISQRRYATNPSLATSSSDRDSVYIADWLNERLAALLPFPFADGHVEFVVDSSADRGNVIKPVVVSE